MEDPESRMCQAQQEAVEEIGQNFQVDIWSTLFYPLSPQLSSPLGMFDLHLLQKVGG
jgi:hypothetical protein